MHGVDRFKVAWADSFYARYLKQMNRRHVTLTAVTTWQTDSKIKKLLVSFWSRLSVLTFTKFRSPFVATFHFEKKFFSLLFIFSFSPTNPISSCLYISFISSLLSGPEDGGKTFSETLQSLYPMKGKIQDFRWTKTSNKSDVFNNR